MYSSSQLELISGEMLLQMTSELGGMNASPDFIAEYDKGMV